MIIELHLHIMMSASCFWLNISRCICICCRPLLGEAVARCRLRFCGGSRPRHADRPAAAAVGRSAARLEIGGRRQLQAVQIVFYVKKASMNFEVPQVQIYAIYTYRAVSIHYV